MSHDQREYQVPIIVDITAGSYEAANVAVVRILDGHQIPGNRLLHRDAYELGLGEAQIESWWTLEREAKVADGNDNEHGVVVFQHDLDYLHAILKRMWEGADFIPLAMVEQHRRLMAYFDPEGTRAGTDDSDIGEDGY